MKIIGIIPARGGSKGIPRKNIKEIAGKPLIYWTIKSAKESKLMTDFYVSTEDKEIAEISKSFGARVIDRPPELATDTAKMDKVVINVINKTNADIIVLLQPTSPVREKGLIDKCIKIFLEKNAEDLATGFVCNLFEYGSYKNNRQDFKGFFHDDGNIFIWKTDLIKNGKRIGDRSERVVISKEQSFEIDDDFDFWLNEQILKKNMQKIEEIKIGNKLINKENCFIIAEAGVNHNGSLELAKKLVDAAAESGVDAIKFQTFKPENLVIKEAPMAVYAEKNIGKNNTQLEMLRALSLKNEDFIELKNYCDKKGIIFLSTPHTEDAIDFLDNLVPLFKIGSGDLTNLDFLKKIANKSKPIILGTGMATLEEIKEALETINLQNNNQVVMLHCTTNYPCPLNEVNLRAMQTLQRELDCLVGYSDHTLGIKVPLIAKKIGAVVIEKHFTLDKGMEGPDHKASIEPDELKQMVKLLRTSLDKIELDEEIMGNPEKKPNESEKRIMKIVRKSIIAEKDIPKGKIIEKQDLIIKRPGTGIKPKYLKETIGKIAKRDIKKDELIYWEDILYN